MICPHGVVAYTVGGSRPTTTGIINLPQQWKQLVIYYSSGSSFQSTTAVEANFVLHGSWRYTETDTSKNAATENQSFKSFKFKLHDKLCHGVFPLFMRTNVTFFLENNNKWYTDILHGHDTP